MTGNGVTDELTGNMIRRMFRNAEAIAELHACLTSPRGTNFRLRLLQSMELPMGETAIERLRVEAGVNEYHRHLHMLFKFGLVREQEVAGDKQYVRTDLGEAAVNALRELERRVGAEAAQAVYSAAIGPNSIRLFLRIYGDHREVDWDRLQISYTPTEMGRLSLFLPRTIEGISAIDKLNVADVLVYGDDDRISMQPLKARAVYQYLQELYRILKSNARDPAPKSPDELEAGRLSRSRARPE
jgi:predicted transcriptional regulator